MLLSSIQKSLFITFQTLNKLSTKSIVIHSFLLYLLIYLINIILYSSIQIVITDFYNQFQMLANRPSLINQQETDNQITKVSEALSYIYRQQTKKISYQTTYQIVYRLCKQGLHQEVADMTIQHTKQHFKFVINNLEYKEDNVGQAVCYVISKLSEVIQRIMEIFLYLETNHRQRQGNTSLRIIFNNILFEILIQRKDIIEKFVFEVAHLKISGDLITAVKLLDIIKKIDEQQIFVSKMFLPIYTPRMVSYYQSEIYQKLLKPSSNLNDYMSWGCQVLQIEQQFMDTIIDKNKYQAKQSMIAAMKQIYSSIVTRYKKQIYNKNPTILFSYQTPKALQLFSKVDNNDVKEHTQWFINVVKVQLNSIQRVNNKDFINNFISFYQKVSQYLLEKTKLFNISYKVKFVFEEWINEEKINIPLRLNNLINQFLQQYHKNKENINLQKFIFNCDVIFKLLKKKDQFQIIYRRMLIKRVTNSIYQKDLQEKLMQIMSEQCGAEWVIKINNLRASIHQFNNFAIKANSKFNGITFEQVSWPFEKQNFNAIIAPELLQFKEYFQKSCLAADPRKKMKWHPVYGTVQVAIKFKVGIATFLIDTCMANILCYLKKNKGQVRIDEFIKYNYYTNDQIKQSLKKIVKSGLLLCSKNNILQLNEQYPQGNIKHKAIIDLTQDQHLDHMECEQMQQLRADRKMMVEAMLVKIIKNSKIATKPQIMQKIAPIIELKGYKFNIEFVDNCIERLIERQFIRDFNDGTFGYIA